MEKRVELNQSKSQYFVYTALILTAIAGIVSGMMIYSYITYAGITYEKENWIMFAISIIVIIIVMVLASLLALAMATGQIN